MSRRPALVRDEGADGAPDAVDGPDAIGSDEVLPSIAFPRGSVATGRAIRLGPDLDEVTLDRIVGNPEGRRVLELGCGTGEVAIELARRGAKVIAVDASAAALATARAAAERAKVKVEFHHGDLAELPFVRAEGIDLAISVYSLAAVEDLGRVFRQVHRVLRSEAPLLFSLPHPLAMIARFDNGAPNPGLVRTAFDSSIISWEIGQGSDVESGIVHPHRIEDVFTTLTRSNFRVDTLLEPRPEASRGTSRYWTGLAEWAPTTVVFRGRKQGI